MIRHHSRLSRLARWMPRRWAVAAPVLPLLLACNANELMKPNPAPEQENDQYYEVNPVRDIDILFMIDNSPSMEEEQKNLTKNFPVFMQKLREIPGGLPNIHVGVVTSDLGAGSIPLPNGGCPRIGGDRGIFHAPNCGLDGNSLFLSSFNNGTMNNFQGSLENTFQCMATVGTQGCGYEHQLQSTRVALYESITKENAGFLRDSAFLAIVLITDEDDCSATTDTKLFVDDAMFPGTAASFRCAQVGHLCDGQQPPVAPFMADLSRCTPNDTGSGRLIKVQEIVDSIKQLKKLPSQQILVSGIFGWPNNLTGATYRYANKGDGLDYMPICTSANGEATAALRMKQFVESFGDSGSFFSICDGDFSPAMEKIGEKLAAKLGNPCISAPVVDTKPNEPGVQPDCQVIDKIPDSKSSTGYRDEPLPPCDNNTRSAGGACWSLAADNGCGESGFKINVDRGGKPATPGTQQAIKCLTCTGKNTARCQHN